MRKKTEEEINSRKKILRISLVVLILVLLILTFNSVFRYLVLLVFISGNYLFALAKKKISRFVGKYFFGIELIMFCTVFTSIAFGSLIGATMGALLMVVNYLAERRFSRFFLVTVPLYMIVGYVSYSFRGTEIVMLGIIITLVYNLLVFFLTSFFDMNRKTLVIFNIVNILFNIFLFATFGRIIEKIIM